MRLTLSILAFFVSILLQGATVTGKITCDGAPVKGVSVSDGTTVVLTAADGTYKIKTPLTLGYVFISIPSGYEVPSDGIIPQFFKRIESGVKEARADFELLKVDQSKCNIIVFNDIHLTSNSKDRDIDQFHQGFFPDVKAEYGKLNSVPVYGITLGDMTTDSRWYKYNYFLSDWKKEINSLPFQVFHSMGNHDNDIRGGSDFAACRQFRDYIGPYYYSFNIGAFHFVTLDDIVYDMPLGPDGKVEKSNDYKTYVDNRQLVWLRNDLKNVRKDTPLIIYTHAPFSRITKVENGFYELKDGFTDGHSSEEVTSLLKGYEKVYLLSGHTHMNYFVELDNGILEHNCVAVAGSSWYTREPSGLCLSSDGLVGGYAVYAIDGKNLSWYYKPSGIAREEGQFRSYDINNVPAEFAEGLSPNTILLNVFNYDPQWKISVSENGKPLAVKQVWVRDPLYSAAVKGQKFSLKGAFKPHKNSHMFVAVASNATSTIDIVVTDRFGNEYRQTMTRPAGFGFDMSLGNK